MRTIIGPRGSGKTTELIKIAHETDQYIVEPNLEMCNFVFRMAREMGLEIRNPVTPLELLRTPLSVTMYGMYHHRGGILVDEAQLILEQILQSGRIDAMAITSQDAPLVFSPGGRTVG